MGADWGDRNEMHQHQPRHLVLQLQTENLPNKSAMTLSCDAPLVFLFIVEVAETQEPCISDHAQLQTEPPAQWVMLDLVVSLSY